MEPNIVGVSCAHNFTLCWDEEGRAYSWGSGHNGVLGQGNSADIHTPTQIEALVQSKITFMDGGHSHSAAVSSDGKIFMFGKGKDGALGLGKNMLKDVLTPTEVMSETMTNISKVSCSVGEHHGHTLAVTRDGTVYAWGDGYKGKLGLGDQDPRFTPTLISPGHFNGDHITNVSAGGIHSSGVSHTGHVFTWGCGSDGRLGHPEAKGHRYLFRSDTPRRVDFLVDKGRAVMVKASYYHTVALLQ